MPMPKKIPSFLLTFILLCAVANAKETKHAVAKLEGSLFEISFPKEMSALPLDGHVLLLISDNNDKEPRFQISYDTTESQQVFGVDVDSLAPGSPVVFDVSTLGYPALSSNDIPAGDYWVQAVLNIYNTFHLANGHTVKLVVG